MIRYSHNDLFHGRYRLISLIGSGGMSQVWEAKDELTLKTYALKIFSYDGKYAEQVKDSFVKEFQLMADLTHPNLFKPIHLDIDANSQSPFLVSKLYRKGSAVSVINKTTDPIDESLIAHFLKDAASALHFLHTQHHPVVHQDIKPDNFLIDDNGKYVLTDFGISIRIRETRAMIEEADKQESFLPGDTHYAAPEKFKGAVARPSQDIFSLGVTLFEILTGVLPFGESGGILLNKGESVPSLDAGFGYTSRLNRICQQCMHSDPKQRTTAEKLVSIAEFYIANSYWPSMDGDISTPGLLKQPLIKILEFVRYTGNQLSAQFGAIRENVVQLINPLLRSPKYIYGILVLFVLTGAGYFLLQEEDPTQKIKASFEEKRYDEVINTIDRIGLSDLAENDTAIYNCIIPYYALSVLRKGDTSGAIQYLENAVEGNDTACIYELGYIYFKSQDYSKAISLFKKGDSLGEPRSATMLGTLYFNGIGVSINESLAVNYFNKASMRKNSYAIYGLGVAYYYGKGVPKDTSRARNYFNQVIKTADIKEVVYAANDFLNLLNN